MRVLVENEMLKLFRRRRFRVVLLLLLAVTALVVFARWRQTEREARLHGARNWRLQTQTEIVRLRNGLRRQEIPETYRRWMTFEAARLQFSLDHGFDPNAQTGPALTRALAASYSFLFLPLLVILFASDLVSSEVAEGTIKVLLTRPARRWKILAAKTVALASAVTITVAAAIVFTSLLGGVAFGWRGWGAPVLSGFRIGAGGELDFARVVALPLWSDALRAWGLAWFAALCAAAIALLLSVLFRTAASAIGTMLAALIAGTILPRIAPSWDFSKYIFVTNLPLPDYYSGAPPPIPGMTLSFSVMNLAIWAAAALLLAFLIFTRRDVLG